MKNRYTIGEIADRAVTEMGDIFSDAPELESVEERARTAIQLVLETAWWNIIPPCPTPPLAPPVPEQFPYASSAQMPPCAPAKPDHSKPLLEQLIAAQDNLTNLIYQTGLADHLALQFRVITRDGDNYWSGIKAAMSQANKECEGAELLDSDGSIPAIIKGGYNLQDITNWLIENQSTIEGLFQTRKSLFGE